MNAFIEPDSTVTAECEAITAAGCPVVLPECPCVLHTFASHCIIGGASLLAVNDLLGPADLNMVLLLAHLAPSKLRDAVQVLGRPPQSGTT